MLTFKPFNDDTAETIRPWFSDTDTKKWLGDESWVDMELKQQAESVGTEFRGVKTIARYGWVVFEGKKAVGYIDASIGDKYLKYDGTNQNKPVYLETENLPTAGLAFLVNPRERGRGIATEMINELVGRPEFADVRIFLAGVEPDNTGSMRALEKAGFVSDYLKDFEGMYYFLLRRM